MARDNVRNKSEFEEKVVHISRVTKVAKGGRTMRFSALVVVGNRKGTVGIGIGKANEVPEAIRKGVEDAKKNAVEINIVNGTIPHEIYGEKGAGLVLLKPAGEGVGVIAGGAVRAVCELAGITNIRAKSLGSANPKSVVNATLAGLTSVKTVEEVARLRGKSVDEILN